MAARPPLAGHARPGVGHSRLHATTTTSPSSTTPPLPTFPPLPAPPPAEGWGVCDTDADHKDCPARLRHRWQHQPDQYANDGNHDQ